ncbi:hypothetical protein DFH07DRAFT_961338 [Mycena maculata]|uniref:Uncharacterized protein n=1 Tax=Mycena maculata TaxID=230809 RepID=A0AAD7N9V6_9AGAR|nr:hypothetical protein DFH07DRAFT_961338 [Mycena maculata]
MDASSEEKGQWIATIGWFHLFHKDLKQAIHYYEVASSYVMDRSGPLHSHILARMAIAFTWVGEYHRGLALAQKARQLAILRGDRAEQFIAYEAEATCQQHWGNFSGAKLLLAEAKELSPVELKHKWEEIQADLHITQTEYSEARTLEMSVLDYRSSCQPPIRDTIVAHLNLASIGIATGSEIESIKYHLDTAYFQCNFLAFPFGLTYCETVAAHLHLREGNISLAREKFEKYFFIFQKGSDVQGLRTCLEGLGDITHKMHDREMTFRWAVIFLAFGQRAKSMLMTVSALRFIGDIISVQGDDETALSLLSAALQAFTLMDVHHQKAKCMISMGAIFERREELEKAVDLWQKSLLLLERCSQKKDIARISRMIQAATEKTR